VKSSVQFKSLDFFDEKINSVIGQPCQSYNLHLRYLVLVYERVNWLIDWLIDHRSCLRLADHSEKNPGAGWQFVSVLVNYKVLVISHTILHVVSPHPVMSFFDLCFIPP